MTLACPTHSAPLQQESQLQKELFHLEESTRARNKKFEEQLVSPQDPWSGNESDADASLRD